MPEAHVSNAQDWPRLQGEAWRPTCTTLHLWSQIVGKVKLEQSPWLNHSWHATLYLTARGLTTSLISYGSRGFQIDFDFFDDVLDIRTTEDSRRRVKLTAQPVSEFFATVMNALWDLDLKIEINDMPSELPDAIPFSEDLTHTAYEAVHARQYWRALLQADRVFKKFRTGFIGKASPVHLFWGAFDLAVTRFSGRRAPTHPGGFPHLPDAVTREAYSHEVSSAGFWPGGVGVEGAAFYSYAYPEPKAFRSEVIRPAEARYEPSLGEFVLPYDAVQASDNPDTVLLEFLQTTYEAAANTAQWDRPTLECALGRPGVPREV